MTLHSGSTSECKSIWLSYWTSSSSYPCLNTNLNRNEKLTIRCYLSTWFSCWSTRRETSKRYRSWVKRSPWSCSFSKTAKSRVMIVICSGRVASSEIFSTKLNTVPPTSFYIESSFEKIDEIGYPSGRSDSLWNVSGNSIHISVSSYMARECYSLCMS